MELENRLLIDGGLAQNFPADIAKQLGCDVVIGLKTNTELQDRENLKNPIQILNQTLNIGQQIRSSVAEQYADIIISPNIDEFSMMDFSHAKLIIEAGYQEGQKHKEEMERLKVAPHTLSEQVNQFPTAWEGQMLPDKIKVTSIDVRGNKHLSVFAVRDYLKLTQNSYYTKEDIYQAFKRAYASELFDHIYPNIESTDGGFRLIVNVKERDRSRLGINLIYNQHDGFIAGSILNMRNVLLRNSNMWVNMQLGGVNAFEADYTKYFTRQFSFYYRLFPYYREDKFYVYNERHETIRSYYSREAGGTAGIGFHSFPHTIIEPYLYFYQIIFTRYIAEVDRFDKAFYSSGTGLKLYYENMDDYPFYMNGTSLFMKYAVSSTETSSDVSYNKFLSSLTVAQPIYETLSFIGEAEIGTYFKSELVEQDPFYIGGINNYMGLNPKEISAPVYRKLNMGLRVNPYNNFYTDYKINLLNYGNIDKFPLLDDSIVSLSFTLGYKTIMGPIRAGFALNKKENNKPSEYYYISVGYDYDAFFFSRR
jgi:NTE family protein